MHNLIIYNYEWNEFWNKYHTIYWDEKQEYILFYFQKAFNGHWTIPVDNLLFALKMRSPKSHYPTVNVSMAVFFLIKIIKIPYP